MAIRIYIDQGHNPQSPNAGAEGNGYREQDLVYRIGIALKERLDADPDFEARLSRPTPETQLGTSNASSLRFRVDDAKLKRAGLDYWHLLDITYYDNLDDFFEKNKNGNFYYFSTKATKIYSEIDYPDNTYLVFGKETAGLPEDLLLENQENCVRLPMINNSAARSLNLSNSVAIGVYEVLRQWNFPELLLKGRLTKFDWKE